jgi:hypothetical protein
MRGYAHIVTGVLKCPTCITKAKRFRDIMATNISIQQVILDFEWIIDQRSDLRSLQLRHWPPEICRAQHRCDGHTSRHQEIDSVIAQDISSHCNLPTLRAFRSLLLRHRHDWDSTPSYPFNNFTRTYIYHACLAHSAQHRIQNRSSQSHSRHG